MKTDITVQHISTSAQAIAPGKTSEIKALTVRSDSLSRTVDRWNDGYVWAGALAVLVAGIVFLAQFFIIRRGRELSVVQSQLIAAKDRQANADARDQDERIAFARQQAAESNAAADKADEAAKKLTNALQKRNAELL